MRQHPCRVKQKLDHRLIEMLIITGSENWKCHYPSGGGRSALWPRWPDSRRASASL